MTNLPPSFRISIVSLAALLIGACLPMQVEMDAQATRIATEIYATLEAEAPLSAADVYAQVAPSIVFLETQSGPAGSGALIEVDGEKFVVTNAHVVWPYEQAWVVFPDGTAVDSAPVLQTDALRDLAVIGPIETDAPTLDLTGSEDVSVGDEVFLVGYPAEADLFPQPAISRGLVSRIRNWQEQEIDFIQTDTAIAGGQSGGALVSGDGAVIGISGGSFGEGNAFALSMATASIHDSLQEMARDIDISGLGDRSFPLVGRQRSSTIELPSAFSRRVLVFDKAPGELIEVEASSPNGVSMFVIDPYGGVASATEEPIGDTAMLSMTTASAGLHLLMVEQLSDGPVEIQLKASSRYVMYEDPDEELPIGVGDMIVGALDFFDDVDTFLVELKRGDRVEVLVDSTQIDPILLLGPIDQAPEDYWFDDDSGRGIYGSNALIEYRAPESGIYRLVVADSFGGVMGGYTLSVKEQ